MITYLRLERFLRHEETEIHFEPHHQLVVVSGANGVGKSSLFAAITWALTGEAPKGLKIDQLVRWGDELEGCEVEVRFAIGEQEYQVVRRRSGVKTTARLSTGDGILLADSPKSVAQEITHIFGVDAAGFRLAYLAEQGELDGLAELTPAERARSISRMLRLDVLAAAKQKAREAYNESRIRTQTVAADVDLDELRSQLSQAEGALTAATEQLSDAQAALATCDAQLVESADTETAWHDAQRAVSAAEATLTATRAEHDRAQAAVARYHLPEPLPEPERDEDAVAADAEQLERAILAAEHGAESARQRQAFERDLAEVRDRLAQQEAKRAELGEPEDRAARRAQLSASLETLTASQTDATEQAATARDRATTAASATADATARLARLEEVGAECDACGQEVGDEHRTSHEQTLRERLEDAQQDQRDASSLAQREQQRASDAARERREVEQQLMQLDYDDQAYAAIVDEEAQLRRRGDSYEASLQRLPVETADTDGLYAQRTELKLELERVRAFARRREEIEQARVQLTELETSRDEVGARLADAEQALAAAQPSADLRAAVDARVELTEKRKLEADTVAHLDRQVAINRERVSHCTRAVKQAEKRLDAKRDHARRARVAEQASVLLTDVEETLATQIRPALEGTISDLLARMSDGRFSSVSIDDDYTVRVVDDSKPVALASLSGGEQDLVALAVRLALAEVVTDRHDAGGAGFLILDEVFGFQDHTRQQTILTALRALRDTYGQILLISHVGGLDELADKVITVSAPAGREITEVTIT